MESYGFIITRHVNSEKTNKYWNQCIKCLRFLYPDKKIIIIDDNSNKDFVKAFYNFENVVIIESEFPGRGELLPYYYFLKHKFFDNAVIIHDSVFFHRRIIFEKLIGKKVIPLWLFKQDDENIENTKRIIGKLKNTEKIKYKLSPHNRVLGMKDSQWYGCFGVQSFINFYFLKHLQDTYNITNLTSTVSCRKDRCCLERIFAAIFYTEYLNSNNTSLFGYIHNYQKWGYTFEEYEKDLINKSIPGPIVKVWTGR